MQIARRQSFVPWHFCQYCSSCSKQDREGNGVGFDYYFDRYILFLETLHFAGRLLTNLTTVQLGLREPFLLSLAWRFGSVAVRGAN